MDIELKTKTSQMEHLETKRKIIIKTEECVICLSKIKNKNKNKHEQSKKRKNFSNLITNNYMKKTVKMINLTTSFNHTTSNKKEI